MKSAKIVACGIVVAIAGMAHAQTKAPAKQDMLSNMYGEVSYGASKVTGNDGVDTAKASPAILQGTLGYQFHENFAVEGRLGFNLSDSTPKVNGVSIPGASVKINNVFGVFIRPSLALSNDFEVFGRLGFARGKVTVSGMGLSESESRTDFAYGVGANYHLSKSTYLTAEYINLHNKNGAKVNTFSVGVGFKF